MSLGEDPIKTLRESPEVAAAAIAVVLGLLMLFVGITSATTSVFRGQLGINGAIELGGVLAGLSVPSLIVGVWLLLPSTSSQKIGVAVGVVTSVIGLVMFLTFYPNQWFGDPTDNTFLVAFVYSVGVLVLLGYLFVGVANLQTQPQQPTRRSRRPAMQQQGGPKSGTEVLKDIVMRKVGRGDDETPEEVGLDLEAVAETLEEEMGGAGFFDSIEVDEDGELVVIERTEDMPHAQFTAGLPPYVSVDEREGNEYRVKIDKESFYVSHPEEDPTR